MPADIVEETLIMALPLAPRHQIEATCRPVTAAVTPQEHGATTRPFADLKSRMHE